MDCQHGIARSNGVKIGDDQGDGVVWEMDIRQREAGIGGAGNRRAVETPLDTQRRCAGSSGVKRDTAATLDGPVRKRAGNRGWQHHS